jgi:hypothetical protein
MRGRCCLNRAASTIVCLIFDPFGLYDESEILPYAKHSVYSIGFGVRQPNPSALGQDDDPKGNGGYFCRSRDARCGLHSLNSRN